MLAIENLKLSVHNSDVILSWPSEPGQSFLVEYRPTLDPETPWVELTNYFRAADGTNRTVLIHSNIVQACAVGVETGGGEPIIPYTETEMAGMLNAILQEHQGEDVYAWGVEDRPPYPWETVVTPPWLLTPPTDNTASENSSESSGGESDGGAGGRVNTGFYRAFNVTPIARDDLFGIEQYSYQSQLSLLANDNDPNEDLLKLSNVVSPEHGDIWYLPDGSVFYYTPAADFYGVDSFTYSVTNIHGSESAANVTVFVNQWGNTPPWSLSQLVITLETNVHVATFNALTNSFDADSDPLSLYAVTTPRLGTVSTNGAGEITYTRNPDFYGSDSFSYIVTDGRGGRVMASVVIIQLDLDADGLPDEWEMRNALDWTVDDSMDDPDSDGLPTLAEFRLSTNPKLADNPLSLTSITNTQPVSGFVRMPLSISPAIENPPLTLQVNNEASSSSLRRGPTGQWYIDWDTGYMTNGEYSVTLKFQFTQTDAGPTIGAVFGHTNTVVVTNIVRFRELNSQFSSVWWVDLRLVYQQANWRIELYDEDGSGLVYFEGNTTNGTISGGWDLTYNGEQIAFGSLRADIYAAEGALPPVGDPTKQPHARRWFSKQIPGGVGDAFVVAWAWDATTTTFVNRRTELMLNGVINLLYDWGPAPGYQLKPSANVAFASAFRYHTVGDKDTLAAALMDVNSGNFFYFGHGRDDTIYGDQNQSSIGPGDIEQWLMNKKHRSRPPRVVQTNAHPYRLVILNACSTYSAEWANAFGFDFYPNGTQDTLSDYYNQGRQPQAFIGWRKDIDVPRQGNPAVYSDQYALGLAGLFSRWMEGYTLEDCLARYAAIMASYDFDGHSSWAISGCLYLRRSSP